MAKATPSNPALPNVVKDQLQKLGHDLALARKRRRTSLRDMAARMMVNLKTVKRMEQGDPSVGVGIIASALWVLGLHRRLGELAAPETDTAGLQEEISRLPRDFRKSRKREDQYDF